MKDVQLNEDLQEIVVNAFASCPRLKIFDLIPRMSHQLVDMSKEGRHKLEKKTSELIKTRQYDGLKCRDGRVYIMLDEGIKSGQGWKSYQHILNQIPDLMLMAYYEAMPLLVVLGLWGERIDAPQMQSKGRNVMHA